MSSLFRNLTVRQRRLVANGLNTVQALYVAGVIAFGPFELHHRIATYVHRTLHSVLYHPSAFFITVFRDIKPLGDDRRAFSQWAEPAGVIVYFTLLYLFFYRNGLSDGSKEKSLAFRGRGWTLACAAGLTILSGAVFHLLEAFNLGELPNVMRESMRRSPGLPFTMFAFGFLGAWYWVLVKVTRGGGVDGAKKALGVLFLATLVIGSLTMAVDLPYRRTEDLPVAYASYGAINIVLPVFFWCLGAAGLLHHFAVKAGRSRWVARSQAAEYVPSGIVGGDGAKHLESARNVLNILLVVAAAQVALTTYHYQRGFVLGSLQHGMITDRARWCLNSPDRLQAVLEDTALDRMRLIDTIRVREPLGPGRIILAGTAETRLRDSLDGLLAWYRALDREDLSVALLFEYSDRSVVYRIGPDGPWSPSSHQQYTSFDVMRYVLDSVVNSARRPFGGGEQKPTTSWILRAAAGYVGIRTEGELSSQYCGDWPASAQRLPELVADRTESTAGEVLFHRLSFMQSLQLDSAQEWFPDLAGVPFEHRSRAKRIADSLGVKFDSAYGTPGNPLYGSLLSDVHKAMYNRRKSIPASFYEFDVSTESAVWFFFYAGIGLLILARTRMQMAMAMTRSSVPWFALDASRPVDRILAVVWRSVLLVIPAILACGAILLQTDLKVTQIGPWEGRANAVGFLFASVLVFVGTTVARDVVNMIVVLRRERLRIK
jgi:hypothetical protein